MHARILTVLTAAALAAPADAHRLDAQAFLLPGKKVRVESWFSGGDAAQGATVHVYGQANELLTEGKLDEQGIWVFSYTDKLPVRIVVSAGAEHLKELKFRAADLVPTNGNPPADAVPLADRNAGTPIKDIVAGVGFLLALAAFVLAIRNGRRIREVERKAKPTEPTGLPDS
jgi:hypothetical protein